MTPNSANSSRGRNRRNKQQGKVDVGKRHFIDSNTSSGSALRVRVADDISRKSTVPDISRFHIPRDFQTQVHWFQGTYQLTTTIASNAVTEYNFAFGLVNLNSGLVAGLVAVFDQYAIFAAYVRMTVNNSAISATAAPTMVTALDYDNVNSLGGNFAQLLGYSTACTTTIAESQERYIEPCNAPALYSGSAFSHYGQARMWVDLQNTGTPHYGFRSMVSALGSGVTGVVTYDVTLVYCCRNVV